MDVRAEGPHEVGSLVYLSPDGAWTLAVVAKATFRLAPETSPLVLEGGDPVFGEDIHWQDDPEWSLRAASDLVPFKRCPEVLVTGAAYAAGGKAVRAAMVRVAFGAVDKTLEVQGDSYFGPDGALSEAVPWTRMPLVWERAAGGPGTLNPVGMATGPLAYPDAWGRIFVPNLWPPWTSISQPGESIAPVGLGPFGSDWPVRLDQLHAQLAWDLPLPADFDGAYYNTAPEDQRMDELTGTETLVLEHLHPRHARLVTRLAPAVPVGVLEAPGAAPYVITLEADTLWIDTDRGIATLTYRGHVRVQDPAEPGVIVVRQAVDTRPSAPAAPVRRPEGGALPFQAPSGPVFAGAALGASAQLQTGAQPAWGTGSLPRAGEAPKAGRQETLELVMPPASPAIPPASPLPLPPRGRQGTIEYVMPVAPAPPVAGLPGVGALGMGPLGMVSPGMGPPGMGPPAAGSPAAAPRDTAEIAIPAAPGPGAGARPETLELPPNVVPPETWGFGGLTPPSAAAPPPGQKDTLGERLVAAQVSLQQTIHTKSGAGDKAAPEPFVPPPTEATEPVQPPPLWTGHKDPDATLDTTETPALPEEPPPPPVPEGPPPLPVEAYPLARCAKISASLDARPDEMKAILSGESLDEEGWERLREHWDTAVEKDLSRQKNKLLREQDAAYVAQIEVERGPVAAGDYARIAAAAEINESGAALEALRIPLAAWPRLRRVWIQNLAKDRKLAAIVQSFLEEERSR